MKSTQSALRVSHLTYIRVMDAVIAEVAALAPAEAVAIINAVVAYLHTADGSEACDNEILRRYFDIIDRAALRSARARQAALNRRKANETPAEAPTESPAQAPEVTMSEPSPEPAPKSSRRETPKPTSNQPAKPHRPRIKIKHKSLSNNSRRRARK